MIAFIDNILSVLFAYGGLIALLKISDISEFREKNPHHFVSVSHDFLVKIWQLPQPDREEKDHEIKIHTSLPQINSIAFEIHPTFLINFYPSTIKLPIPSWFPAFICLLLFVTMAKTGSVMYETGITWQLVKSILLQFIALIILAATAILITGHVFRRTLIYLEKNSIYIFDDLGHRRIPIVDMPLQVKLVRKKEFIMGETTYIFFTGLEYKDIRLMYCPTKLEKLVLKETPEETVNLLNISLKAVTNNA